MYFNTLMRIADLNVEFETDYYCLIKKSKDFVIETGTPDLSISVSSEELEAERAADASGSSHNNGYYETVCAYRNLVREMWRYDGLILHSASFMVDGQGVAFCAKSGTGKSTHLLLWQKLLGDRLTIVNGDKPIVRFKDGTPVIYGTPFMGKERLGGNVSAPLRHICFIERSPVNEVLSITRQDAVDRIMRQTIFPSDHIGLTKTLSLINSLTEKCKLWVIRCNMDPAAAETSYRALFGE